MRCSSDWHLSKRVGEGGENYISKQGWKNGTSLPEPWANPLLEQSWLYPRSAKLHWLGLLWIHTEAQACPHGSCFQLRFYPWLPLGCCAAVVPVPWMLLLWLWPWPSSSRSDSWPALVLVLLLQTCLVSTHPCLMLVAALELILSWLLSTPAPCWWGLSFAGWAAREQHCAPHSTLTCVWAFQTTIQPHSLKLPLIQNPSETELPCVATCWSCFCPAHYFQWIIADLSIFILHPQ